MASWHELELRSYSYYPGSLSRGASARATRMAPALCAMDVTAFLGAAPVAGALARLAVALFFAAPAAHALDDGLARVPPLGWNSDNFFGDDFPNYCLCDGVVAPTVRPAWLDKFCMCDCRSCPKTGPPHGPNHHYRMTEGAIRAMARSAQTIASRSSQRTASTPKAKPAGHAITVPSTLSSEQPASHGRRRGAWMLFEATHSRRQM